MIDGSMRAMRAIKGSIHVQTWWAPGTMANGEVIGADAY
jgi:hypothetical protein